MILCELLILVTCVLKKKQSQKGYAHIKDTHIR